MLSALERAGRHHDRAGQLRRVAQEVEPLEIEPELAEHVYWSVANPLNLEVDLLFFDTTSTLAVTREGIPIRVWTWPGNASDQELIRQVKDDLRAWKLGRVARVADRGFNSAANRRYLQRAGGHYIIGEKLRGDSAEAKATLARQGRYHHVAGNLEVKEVVLDEGTLRDRFLVCRNPETATPATPRSGPRSSSSSKRRSQAPMIVRQPSAKSSSAACAGSPPTGASCG